MPVSANHAPHQSVRFHAEGAFRTTKGAPFGSAFRILKTVMSAV
jgi:hypothetical protein